jgi:hypothetical protein
VRNGFLPQREVLTGAGSLEVHQPRVRDKRGQVLPSKLIPALSPCSALPSRGKSLPAERRVPA